MDNQYDWKHWFEYSENDFEVVTILANQAKPKIEIVCYHCQQSAEKMIKGYIAAHGGRLQKTHDLVVLCETCISYDNTFETILHNCSDLSIYASEIRYPNVLDIELYHMHNAIDDMNVIREFIFNKIK